MPRDPGADDLFAEHPDAVIRAAQRLRDVLLEAQPDLVERARTGWHSVNYRHPTAGFVCALFPYTDRVDLVFEHGARLPDPDGHLMGTTRQVRTLRVLPDDGVDPDIIVEFLDAAVEIGAGLRARRR
jgi:hypothetical protein